MEPNFDIETYCEALQEGEAEIMRTLHFLITELPGIRAKERYKIPFYFGKSWICYLNKLKNGGVELAFTRGIELKEVKPLLNFKGRKQIGGIQIKSMNDFNRELVMTLLLAAIELDQAVPYSHPKNRK